MEVARALSASVAAVATFSLVIGPAHIASADAPADSVGTQIVKEENITHGELYDSLNSSSLEAKNSSVGGQTITTFTSKDGISLSIPKPTTSSNGIVGPQISGKISPSST